MTKTLSTVSHTNLNLNANEGFVMNMTSKLMTCFMNNFTSKKESQSIAYLLNGSGHIYWILDLDTMSSALNMLYGQAAFRTPRIRPGSGAKVGAG